MGRFLLRRLASAAVVLFTVSVLTFLIFEVIPNGNPALRLADGPPLPPTSPPCERAYGFNKPVYVQYLRTMEQVFTGRIVSYAQNLNVVSQIRRTSR